MIRKKMLRVFGVGLMLVGGSVLNAQTWSGATSSDWATGSNWNTGSEPTTSSNVVIGAQANNPVVSTAGVLRSLSFGENATGSGAGPTLTVASGGSLTFAGRGPNIYEGTINVEAGASFTSNWEFYLGGTHAGYDVRTILNISGDVLQSVNPHQVRIGNALAHLNRFGYATVNLDDGTFYIDDLIFNKGYAGSGVTPDSHIFISNGELRLPDSFEASYDNDWVDDEIQAVSGLTLDKRVEGGHMFITAVPEPAALSLLALGGLALLLRRQR